ncbi:UNVERIFIED_CONTAM: Deoxycytidine monophosphate (dCMP) deaminase [Siphonaria sp. JEL0065]|nr:Deoxycytidine monophosphate (dCMP) deaminase [Siphonaria sp. JEL0065]
MPVLCFVGPTHSGKRSIANHFVETHGFKRLRVQVQHDETRARSDSSVVLHDDNDNYNDELGGTLTFPTSAAALAFATLNWRESFVVADLFALLSTDAAFNLADWQKRPFVLIVAVTAETLVRFNRANSCALSLEEFVRKDDAGMHKPPSLPSKDYSLFQIMNKASVSINNSFSSLHELHALLDSTKVNLLDPHRLRPSWDLYFMRLCDLAAERSNCMKRRVGCVVAKDNRVIATGYNGTPKGLRNCNDGGCARCNEGVERMGGGLEFCICLHAEENALLEAGRDRISNGGKAILYCNTCPCIQCARKIIQVGISEVVYSLSYGMDGVTLNLFNEAGVVLRQLDQLESCF